MALSRDQPVRHASSVGEVAPNPLADWGSGAARRRESEVDVRTTHATTCLSRESVARPDVRTAPRSPSSSDLSKNRRGIAFVLVTFIECGSSDAATDAGRHITAQVSPKTTRAEGNGSERVREEELGEVEGER